MTRFNNIRKSFSALAIALCMALSSSSVCASAAEQTDSLADGQLTVVTNAVAGGDSVNATTYYLNRTGVLAPGQTISGTVTLPNILGNNFKVAGCADNSNRGSIKMSFVAESYTVPGDCVARVLYTGKNWSRGTYSYSVTNTSSYETAYTISVYKA